MEVFYAPMACSVAARAALYDVGQDAKFTLTDFRAKKLANGDNYLSINPKGQVPALKLEDGTILTDISAILPYIARLSPDQNLMPPEGTIAHSQVHSWIGYIASEIHKQVIWFIFGGAPEPTQNFARVMAPYRLKYVEKSLKDSKYLIGDTITVADFYMLWALTILQNIKIDLSDYPLINSYMKACLEHPSLKRAFDEEMAEFSAMQTN